MASNPHATIGGPALFPDQVRFQTKASRDPSDFMRSPRYCNPTPGLKVLPRVKVVIRQSKKSFVSACINLAATCRTSALDPQRRCLSLTRAASEF